MRINGRILASVFVIASVMFGLGFGTMAYFSDVENVPASTLTAAVIDISVADESIKKFELEDLKPCQTAYLVFEIFNDGDNPVDVYKHLFGFVFDEGTPDDITGDPGYFDMPYGDNLADWILYDLSVEIPLSGGHSWWQMIYDEDISMGALDCVWVYLGMLPVGHTMTVTQSYHMRADVGNWAQGDTIDFLVEVKGDQLTGYRKLENKANPKWKILHNDGMYGDLTYTVRGPTFDYSFNGYGLVSGSDYSLIYYPDPWPGTGLEILGSGIVAGDGTLSFSGSPDCGSLPIAGDHNSPGAKIFLVLSGDIAADGNSMTGWNADSYLFDTGLIEYTRIP